MPRGVVRAQRDAWDLELDWRGFEATFPEKRESWLTYDRQGAIASRNYYSPGGR